MRVLVALLGLITLCQAQTEKADACCKAMTIDCLMCSLGVDRATVCKKYPSLADCGGSGMPETSKKADSGKPENSRGPRSSMKPDGSREPRSSMKPDGSRGPRSSMKP